MPEQPCGQAEGMEEWSRPSVAQSDPENPSSHEQTPPTQAPCPEQPEGQSAGSAQLGPFQPVGQLQRSTPPVAVTQVPRPLQVSGQVAAQSAPACPGAQRQLAQPTRWPVAAAPNGDCTHVPWPEQSFGQVWRPQPRPA